MGRRGAEVEASQELTGNHDDRACNNNYRVPLISQEQAYANCGLQVNQVTTPDDSSGTAVPVPPGEARWGLRRGSQEQGPTPRRTEQGVTRR